MLNVANVHHDLDIQASKRREVSQSVPRPARVRMSVQTTGVGETRLTGKDGVSFGLFMLEEPTFSFGVVAQGALATDTLPICTAIVLSWSVNDQGMYTGAEMGFRVYSNNDNIPLTFSLTFEGSSLRSTFGVDDGSSTTNGGGSAVFRGSSS